MKRISAADNFAARLGNHYSELRWYAYRVLTAKRDSGVLWKVRLDNAFNILESMAANSEDETIGTLHKYRECMDEMRRKDNEQDHTYLNRIKQGEYLPRLAAMQNKLFEISDWLRTQPPLKQPDNV